MAFMVSLVYSILKAVSLVYDFVTIVPYYLACQPGEKLKRSRRLKARPVGDAENAPYRCTDIPMMELTVSLFPECQTLDDLLVRAVRTYGSKQCLGTREQLSEEDEVQPNGRVFKKVILGDYKWITFEELFTRVTNLGSGLLALGQKPKKNILIFAETRAEWMIAAQACFKYNFPVVTLYATLGADAIVHGVNESEVSYVITSAELLPKFKGIIDQMPKVTHLICMTDGHMVSSADFPSHVKLLSFNEVEMSGALPDNIQTPVTKPTRDDVAVIMYTSGSTGIPKGVIISHGNLMSGMSGQCQRIVGLGLCDCVLMPYDKVYSDGIRADPEASYMTTRSDGELDVVCPAQQLVVTMKHCCVVKPTCFSLRTTRLCGPCIAAIAGDWLSFGPIRPDDTYIGYLPLAHVLELSAETACLAHGTSIGYSSPLTLTDQSSKIKKGSKGDVSVLKPTLMAAVPVIMDRLYKGVWEKVHGGSAISQGLFQFAYVYKNRAIERGYEVPILNKLLFSKIQQLLGGRLRMMLSGGAPLSEKTQRFMNICFCCPVLQGYGLTETCGAGTVTDVADMSTGRVGAPLTCCEIRLRDWVEGNYTYKDKPYPRGEILVGGGNVVQGYYKNEAKTKEDFTVIDGIRYFCTGDIGQFETDGCLRVIDRMKDLVKLQHGEFISLSRVETVLKMSPLVDQICIHAHSSQSVCIALIVPNQKRLTEVAAKIGIKDKSFEDLCSDERVVKEVLKQLADVAKKGKLEKFEVPAKLMLCTEMWMPDTGLVTDAFKLKRKNIEEKFRPSLERMYSYV